MRVLLLVLCMAGFLSACGTTQGERAEQLAEIRAIVESMVIEVLPGEKPIATLRVP